MALANNNKPASAPAPKGRAEQGNGRPLGDPVPDTPPDLGKAVELKAYRDMLLIRRFEEKAGQMYGMGLLGGFCHL
jgi:TPP-dependent pyruvate/acetoin dehydrogenase alpha subunit